MYNTVYRWNKNQNNTESSNLMYIITNYEIGREGGGNMNSVLCFSRLVRRRGHHVHIALISPTGHWVVVGVSWGRGR